MKSCQWGGHILSNINIIDTKYFRSLGYQNSSFIKCLQQSYRQCIACHTNSSWKIILSSSIILIPIRYPSSTLRASEI